MRYVCLGCGKEREIGAAAAWPSSCECGSTSWTSPPPTELVAAGTIDPVTAANAALRQPGAPRIQPRF